MKYKINSNPNPYKKRKCLADMVFLDMRLLYMLPSDDNCLDNDFKPSKPTAVDSVKYQLVDSKVMSRFINHLINDYLMN